jgi:dihydroflavonol-4-reductase
LCPPPDHPLFNVPEVERHFADLRDQEAMRKALAGCSVIFNASGAVSASGKGLSEIHLAGIQNTLQSAPAEATIVHTSSIVTIGATKDGTPLNENSPFHPENLRVDYVQAKRQAEQFAFDQARTGRVVLLANPGYLVGPDDFGRSLMGRFCRRFWSGRMPLAPPGGFNFVDVRDVAAGHILLAEKGSTGRFILGGANVSLIDFLWKLAETAQARPRFLLRLPGCLLSILAEFAEAGAWLKKSTAFPSRQDARTSRLFWYVDSSRALRELGYSCRPLDETLRDTWQWHMETNPLRCRGLARWWMRPAA